MCEAITKCIMTNKKTIVLVISSGYLMYKVYSYIEFLQRSARIPSEEEFNNSNRIPTGFRLFP